MNAKEKALVILDSFVQGLLWALLCFAVIRRFHLEGVWYLACAAVLTVEIGLLYIHQKITFPAVLRHLGYEPNEKLEEAKLFKIGDHLPNIIAMFGVVYLCINGFLGRLI